MFWAMPLQGFTGLTTLRVTGRFGVHASTSLRGFSTSNPSASRVWTSSCWRIVSAARGTSGAACYSLRASARARAAKTGFSLLAQPPGAMARRVDAAPLLRHLGVAAAPPRRPPATTSKVQPEEQARPPSQDFRPLADFPLVGSAEYAQADDYTRDRAREAANWWRAYARWDALGADTSPADADPSDTSPAIVLQEFPEPEAPEPSAIPLPRMLVAGAPQPPPPWAQWALPCRPGPQPHAPRAPLTWPWPQPGRLTLPRPAFGGRKAAPARARAGLSAKYAPPLAASLVQPTAPPSCPVPEPHGPPRPHEPPALHLRGGPAGRQKEVQSPRRSEDAGIVRSSSTAGSPGSHFALGAAVRGGAHPPSDEGSLEAPGLRLLHMSSLHALGFRARGSSGSAAADAALLVPGLSESAAASASATASALRAAGSRATPANRSDAQVDPQAALRALAKSRSLRRLERDVEAGAGSMKALKRRARGRERAEVHRGSQRGTSDFERIDGATLGRGALRKVSCSSGG